MKKYIYTIVVAALLISCDKGKADITIRGSVSDQTFGTTLSGGAISLYSIEPGSQAITLIDEQVIGADGAYSFTFPRDQVEGFNMVVDKANYFPVEEFIPFGDLTIEDDNYYDYSAAAIGWVKLTFFNTAPLGTDLLDYYITAGEMGCATCHPSGTQTLVGAVDTSFIYPNLGNTNFTYNYNVLGSSDAGTKSAVTIAFDTTEIILMY